MKRRKIAVMGLVLCLVSGIFSACGDAAKKDAVASGESGETNLYYDAGSDGSLSGVDTFAGSEGTGGEESAKVSGDMDGSIGLDAVSEAEAPLSEAEPGGYGQVPPRAGLLTAGEWRDNENWGFFTNLVRTGRVSFRQFGMAPYQRVVVQALSDGVPAAKVKVRLCTASGSAISCAVTDHNGKAYLYYNVYGEGEVADHVIFEKMDSEILMPLSGEEISSTEVDNAGQGNQPGSMEELSDAQVTAEIGSIDTPLRALDLMFVFDTTGSMGDELLYLQKEFEDIAGRVADQSTRFSVNFYRDHGDAYIVHSNPFSDDIKAASALINAESADGGGDYEEAVDEALINAVMEHEWREEASKILFLILDAPPHDTDEVAANLRMAVEAATAQGIRIIPIAASGVNEKTEAFLRSIAMLTGGTYTFLTDDSGVGNSHLEPTVGSYSVEALNDLIVRLVKEYYGE